LNAGTVPTVFYIFVIKDCERDVQVGKNAKVYFKWGWNKSPFDSVVFHHISTIFLLNAGTVPTVFYIFFHFIIGYEKKHSWVAIVKKKYGCDRLPHDHRWAKTIDEAGPLLSMSSIKLGLLNAY
jgi:hypothetical protein